MKAIGCGFGRTGTSSLKEALDILGFGPTLHNSEFTIPNFHLNRPWMRKVNGIFVPWDGLFQGYESAVDWPVCYYWKQLLQAYPEAKFILTHRPVKKWLASFKETILPNILTHGKSDAPWLRFGISWSVIGILTFNNDFSDENLIRSYRLHFDQVCRTIPKDRLLVYRVSEGWKPLCKFLDVPVPAADFPRLNEAAEFSSKRRFLEMPMAPDLRASRADQSHDQFRLNGALLPRN